MAVKQLILPHDGSVVHIVHSPEEAEDLKRSQSGEDFSWHFHGSPEHVEKLRKVHDHHSGRANALREENPELHNEMDAIRHEMDKVASELDKLTSKPVELEANFDRFGYSAHIRTHADPEKAGSEEEPVDGAVAAGIQLRPKTSHSRSTTMKLFRTPIIRQYFHKGLLYRAREMEEVASFELFIDLLYVGIIAFNGDKATEDPTGNGLLRFAITFIPSWKIWSEIGSLVSQFETNDIMQRVVILFVLACLVGFTTNIVMAFESTYAQLITFYLAARLAMSAVMAMIAIIVPHVRPIMSLTVGINLIPIVLWLGSIWVDEPRKEALIWIAIAFDLWGGLVSVFFIRGSQWVSQEFHERMLNIFAYYPAVNIEHKTERTGAFVSLVFGYSVVALLYQNQASFGMNAFFGKAILALIQAYCFNWIYFDVDGSYHHVHAIRRHALSASVWLNAHLPFIMAFTISGAALSRLVVAHDCSNADIEKLTETYQERSEGELADGLRWFYGCGLGVAFICMTLISASHVHTPLESQRMRKRTRLGFRIAVSIVWILLPLAKNLNSLQLISITTGMTVFTLAVEIYGTSCEHESFFQSECDIEYDCRGRLSRTQTNASTLVGEGDNEVKKEATLTNYLCKSG